MRLGITGLDALLGRACDDAGITPRTGQSRVVEVVRCQSEDGHNVSVINHSAGAADVPLKVPARNT